VDTVAQEQERTGNVGYRQSDFDEGGFLWCAEEEHCYEAGQQGDQEANASSNGKPEEA
jgi:hypothetical protein